MLHILKNILLFTLITVVLIAYPVSNALIEYASHFDEDGAVIPDITYSLSQERSEKLAKVSPIKVKRFRPLKRDVCRDGYLLLSNGTTMGDDKAQWFCEPYSDELNCPDMDILINNNGNAAVSVWGEKKDYSPNMVEVCAFKMINSASEDFSFTSNESKREADEKNNLELWKGKGGNAS